MNIDEIKSKALPVLRQYGVTSAVVFGSYAKGEQVPDSDIDILIDYPSAVSFTLFTLVRLKGNLQKALGKKVDVVTERSLLPFIREHVQKEKKIILL